MGRSSTVDRLGPEVRDAIGRLLDQGRTLDEILAALEGMDVEAGISRSALGRWTKQQGKLREKMQRARTVSDALVRRFGDQPESKLARANIELLHGAILEGFVAEPEEGEEEGTSALAKPQSAMFLARALESLTKASRHDVEYIERAERRAAEKMQKQAATVAATAAKERGMSAELVEAIKASILGIKAA